MQSFSIIFIEGTAKFYINIFGGRRKIGPLKHHHLSQEFSYKIPKVAKVFSYKISKVVKCLFMQYSGR